MSNQPLWMYENSNFRIAGGLLNAGGLYTTIEAGLQYNETLGFWRGKNGQFFNLDFNGNGYTGGKLKYGKMMRNKFINAGRMIGSVGVFLSAYQCFNSSTFEEQFEYGFDAVIGAAGVVFPEFFGIVSTVWFCGGKQLTYWYGENVITPMIEEGINPGLMIYQPFK